MHGGYGGAGEYIIPHGNIQPVRRNCDRLTRVREGEGVMRRG
jgi:hypothetical protein